MRSYVIRLQPGEDLVNALVAAARTLGVQRGVVRGGPGSLMSAVLTAGRHRVEAPGPAVEILTLFGELTPRSATLDGTVGDPTGRVHAGRFLAGFNPVCITVELILEVLD